MKTTIVSLAAALALVGSARATDVTAKISDIHMCCNSCVNTANKAVATVPGVKAEIDKDAETVVLTGPDAATVQKAADALVEAGYFGTSKDVKLNAMTGAKDAKVSEITVSGVHLCCASCVTAVNNAVKSVPGVTGTDAKRNAKTFVVNGTYNDKDVFAALQKAGLTGKEAAK